MSFINPAWSFLEVLYYVSTPLLVIIGIIGFISIIYTKGSIDQAKTEFAYKTKRDSIQRAVELSRFYSNEIIPMLQDLNKFFYDSKFEQETRLFNKNQFYNFDREELKGIISECHKGESQEKVVESINNSLLECLNKNQKIVEKDKEITITATYRLEKLLNNLEYFSMNFICGIADWEAIYCAIHQTFLATVENLYFPIAHLNEEPKDKYYNNIIELYKIWSTKDKGIRQEYEKKILEHQDSIRTLSPRGSSISV